MFEIGGGRYNYKHTKCHPIFLVTLITGSSVEPDPLPPLKFTATSGGTGLAHTNSRANGSGLHRKAVVEIKPHSMNLIKDGMCQNEFCASESCIISVGLTSLMNIAYEVDTCSQSSILEVSFR